MYRQNTGLTVEEAVERLVRDAAAGILNKANHGEEYPTLGLAVRLDPEPAAHGEDYPASRIVRTVNNAQRSMDEPPGFPGGHFV